MSMARTGFSANFVITLFVARDGGDQTSNWLGEFYQSREWTIYCGVTWTESPCQLLTEFAPSFVQRINRGTAVNNLFSFTRDE